MSMEDQVVLIKYPEGGKEEQQIFKEVYGRDKLDEIHCLMFDIAIAKEESLKLTYTGDLLGEKK